MSETTKAPSNAPEVKITPTYVQPVRAVPAGQITHPRTSHEVETMGFGGKKRMVKVESHLTLAAMREIIKSGKSVLYGGHVITTNEALDDVLGDAIDPAEREAEAQKMRDEAKALQDQAAALDGEAKATAKK